MVAQSIRAKKILLVLWGGFETDIAANKGAGITSYWLEKKLLMQVFAEISNATLGRLIV